MPASDVQKTKEIAKRRKYVEQVIRRIILFRLLNFGVPVTVCKNKDDILKTVCGMPHMQSLSTSS